MPRKGYIEQTRIKITKPLVTFVICGRTYRQVLCNVRLLNELRAKDVYINMARGRSIFLLPTA